MKKVTHCLGILALLVGSTGPAHAVNYSGLYVFGDSLVDSGNANWATAGGEASFVDGYFAGRFSNGLNFADYLALSITGAPATPIAFGGTNVAVGGADAQYKPGQASPSFLEQIGLYNSFVGQPIAGDALVLLTFGGNDVRDTIGTGGPVDFTGAGNDFLTGLGLLYGLGARNFIITGSPDIGLLPVSVAATGGNIVRLGELSQRSEDISTLLATQTDLFAASTGAQTSFFDLLGFEHSLLANPAAFGLSPTLNTTLPCQVKGAGVPQVANCANSLYFDAIHPTTPVHEAIADRILAQLAVPEPGTWLMMILGFGAIGMALRGRRRRAFLGSVHAA